MSADCREKKSDPGTATTDKYKSFVTLSFPKVGRIVPHRRLNFLVLRAANRRGIIDLNLEGLLSRDAETHGDTSRSRNGFARLVVGLEVPLFDRFQSSRSEHRGTTDYLYSLDVPVLSDAGL